MELNLDGVGQGERIRNLFLEQGSGEGLRRFTHRCIDSGLFDDTQIDGFLVVGAMKTVKAALKVKDDHGIQFAYNTTKQNGDEAIWKRQPLLEYKDACFILQDNYIEKVVSTHAEMVNFQTWMRRRFGTAPSIPMLE